MGFDGFASILLPLLPALVALYFLKLKRREEVVSSTWLWKRSLEDLHVNSPFQKLRRSLLLLLQLLALAALVLAASKPVITGSTEGGRNLLVLIDSSASMSAVEDGASRRDLARAQALSLVEGMVGGDRMSVMTFAARTQVLQPLTADRTALRRAVESVPATALTGDLLQALRTVEAVSKSLPAAELFVIGDGAYGGLGPLPEELGRFALKFLAVGKGSDNVGITELDVRRTFGARQRLELFASVQNHGAEERKVGLGVYASDGRPQGGGGRLLAAAELTIPAGRSRTQTFDVGRFLEGDGEAGSTVLSLEIDRGGLLAEDDRALVRVQPPRRLEALVVGEENPFLDRVLAVQAQLDARRLSLGGYEALASSAGWASDPARVIIFDRRAPAGIPDRPALFLGCAPAAPELLEGGAPLSIKAPAIVDWDRAHPVNRFLAFADLRIEESLGFVPGRAYRSLLDAGERSIAGAISLSSDGRPPVAGLIVGFDLMKSNWPWLHSFPIFVGNALEWLSAAAGSEAQPRYRTGDVLAFHPGERKLERPLFRDPSGREHPATVERSGALTFAGTDLAGIHELRAGGETIETYPVSLLSAVETALAPRAELRFGEQVVASEERGLQTRDLWKWFALAALALIGLEWWVYNRRMHV